MSKWLTDRHASARASTTPLSIAELAPKYFGRILIFILVVTSIIQFIISPSSDNFASVIISSASSVIVILYLFESRAFSRLPVSGIMLFGLNFTLSSGPLIFQTLDWRAFAYNLENPIKTSSLVAAISLSAVLTHVAYYHSSITHVFRARFSDFIIAPLGVFRTVSDTQLWAMGAVGMTAMWISGTFEARSAIDFGDIGGKLLQGLIPFTVAPFLIPLANALLRPNTASQSTRWVPIIVYFSALLLVAFARNSRAAFSSVLLVLGLCVFLAFLLGRIRVNRRTALAAAAAALMGVPALGLLSDLSTAMLMSRSQRGDMSATELVGRTIEAAGDKQALKLYRVKSEIISGGYNEIYIRNDFFQRLTLLKFLDLNVTHIDGITESQRDFARFKFRERLISNLPSPILGMLDLNVNKRDQLHSGGDVYRLLSSRGQLGWYATGSAIADGLAIMGLLFWPAAMAFFFLSYFLYDALTRGIAPMTLLFSPVALMQIDRLLMFGLAGENVADAIGGVLRYYPQTLLIYAGLYLLTLPAAFIEARLTPRRRQENPGSRRAL